MIKLFSAFSCLKLANLSKEFMRTMLFLPRDSSCRFTSGNNMATLLKSHCSIQSIFRRTKYCSRTKSRISLLLDRSSSSKRASFNSTTMLLILRKSILSLASRDRFSTGSRFSFQFEDRTRSCKFTRELISGIFTDRNSINARV
ncbi:Hypothetical_protein [Hexamita inflata]|uniref:Hypothetical_protein n=1 Tax=Hexamita inflata TaxID=28002 RepID=A0ABP1JXE9_9EUKA